MRRSLFLLVTVLVVGIAAPAQAAVALTGPGGFLAGYIPPVVVTAPDETITYVNADIAPHNFVALDTYLSKKAAKKAEWCSAYDKGKCPLFWSPQISIGQSTEVSGVEFLKSGKQYGFYCSLHPNMKGTLIVR